MKKALQLQQRRWNAVQEEPAPPNEKEKALLVVFTGDGKGKTSAAFGMGWRAVCQKMKVGVVQFLGGSRHSAEYQLLGKHPLCDFHIFGGEFSMDGAARTRNTAVAAVAWAQAELMLADPYYQMIILDEINPLIYEEYIDLGVILTRLAARMPGVHVVLTGRKAPYELMDVADLVTEMRNVRHPYSGQAVAAQAGIEF
jgi:cob(I)alamin adenosyltransferase